MALIKVGARRQKCIIFMLFGFKMDEKVRDDLRYARDLCGI